MKKSAKVSLKSNDFSYNYDILLDIENRKINYFEPTEKKTNVFFDIDNNILVREDKEIFMEYLFVERGVSTGNLYIKDLGKNVDVSIVTENILKDDKRIEIDYSIDNDFFEYIIDME